MAGELARTEPKIKAILSQAFHEHRSESRHDFRIAVFHFLHSSARTATVNLTAVEFKRPEIGHLPIERA